MHDDRADAFVWCMIHLAGDGQGDWGMVYGFRDCGACGARVNEDKDRQCKNCGADVGPPGPQASRRPARPGTLVRRLPEHLRELRENVPAP